MSRRRAFTLIELLVVVAIIALLIAILLPSLGKAKKAAQSAKCLANVRGMATAANTYIADWSRMFPYTTSSQTFWVNLLKGYANIDKIRICPMTTVADSNPNGNVIGSATTCWESGPGGVAGVDPVTHQFYSGSYGINGYLELPGPGQPDYANQTLASATRDWYWTFPFATRTAEIPVFCDALWYDGWPHANERVNVTINPGTFANHMGRYCLNRHDMKVNVSFLDGHGSTVKLKELWTLRWNAQWGTAAEPIPNPLPDPPNK